MSANDVIKASTDFAETLAAEMFDIAAETLDQGGRISLTKTLLKSIISNAYMAGWVARGGE